MKDVNICHGSCDTGGRSTVQRSPFNASAGEPGKGRAMRVLTKKMMLA